MCYITVMMLGQAQDLQREGVLWHSLRRMIKGFTEWIHKQYVIHTHMPNKQKTSYYPPILGQKQLGPELSKTPFPLLHAIEGRGLTVTKRCAEPVSFNSQKVLNPCQQIRLEKPAYL